MKSVSWNVKVHDSEGSSPYSHAETRVESLELSNWRKRRPGQSPPVLIGDELYPPRLSRTVLNCLRTISRAMRKGYSRSHPRSGYSTRHAAQRILTSGKGEKIRFLKRKKHSYLAPGDCQNLPIDKGEKRESAGMPTLSTGCYACPMFGHSIDGSHSSPSELQWIDSSDKGRSSKDERWQ